jgi:hypothetical protein
MASINVIFHSVTGHTYKLAVALGEGISSLSGCEARLLQIPELPGMGPVIIQYELRDEILSGQRGQALDDPIA